MLQDVTSLFPQLSTRMKLTLPEVWPASNFFFRFIKTWGGWPRCMITLWNDWLFFLPRNPGGERLEKRNESRSLSLSLFFSLSLSICVHTRVHSGCMRVNVFLSFSFSLSVCTLNVFSASESQIHETGDVALPVSPLRYFFPTGKRGRFNKRSGNIAVLVNWNRLKLEWLISPAS